MSQQNAATQKFIKRWRDSAGDERANAQPFVSELCGLLGVEPPEPAKQETALNDYVFERRVTFKHRDGTESPGRIDCYKRDSFVLEAKQSVKRSRLSKPDAASLDFFGEDAGKLAGGTAKQGTRAWDVAMLNARTQAEDYARALPKEHGWPPFIIVVDVAHCIEVYADFSRQGKNYAQFPDAKSFRIMLDDLAAEEVRERLKLIWTNPLALDPARRSAEVTRDIAERLAKIAKALEEKKHDPETVALFLMRCLFTMFAEDVELLPKDSFTGLLDRIRMNPDVFPRMMESLWRAMDRGEFHPGIEQDIRRFNGQLFANCQALRLESDQLNELYIAAKRDWRDVEPAIFGTLLERALNPAERDMRGAHFTPRSYVERLVVPTIIEPLTADWKDVQAVVEAHMREGAKEKAVKAVRDFHAKLCSTRVLDPACGTGNFLYVAMELMKRLEGEVLDYLARLDASALLAIKGATVDPHQFLGLEINPRAVAIAELVLWLGFLKWQLRTGIEIAEPILKRFDNIRHQDAVLAFDREELRRDAKGGILTQWNGRTFKKHPVTGENVPDEDARVELINYVNSKPAKWPDAEYIVGNPPFIGNKRMILRLGEGYVEALRAAHSSVPETVDFVTYWWDLAARQVEAQRARRFGFICTNSFRQIQNRNAVGPHLEGKNALSIVFAIPDHPWVDVEEAAAVRICMTAAERGDASGLLAEIAQEIPTKDGASEIIFSEKRGKIDAALRVGASVSSVSPLKSNEGLSYQGVKLVGEGFQISRALADAIRTNDKLISLPRYWAGRDLTKRPSERYVIDLFGKSEREAQSHVTAFDHLLLRVKPFRDQVRRQNHRKRWWVFGEARPGLRESIRELSAFIVTSEVAKHRFFTRLDPKSDMIDGSIVGIALSESWLFAVLSSRVHVTWALAAGGTLEDRPRYNNTVCFDPFPFPDPPPALKEKLRALGEWLDAFRKERQAAHPDLTITAMYNVLERLREHDPSRRRLTAAPQDEAKPAPLTPKEKRIHEQGLISTLKQIHDDIDASVFEAYGWPADLSDEEILERLVALNKERAEEERQGKIRWLRPDFQAPREKPGAKPAAQIEADLPEGAKPKKAGKPTFPAGDGAQQIRDIRAILAGAGAPLSAAEIAARFRKSKDVEARVVSVLDIFVDIGQAQTEGGRYYLA